MLWDILGSADGHNNWIHIAYCVLRIAYCVLLLPVLPPIRGIQVGATKTDDKNETVLVELAVQWLRHHLGPHLTHCSALYATPTRAAGHTIGVLLMLMLIHVGVGLLGVG